MLITDEWIKRYDDSDHPLKIFFKRPLP